MQQQRKASHQPYGNIEEALDSELSFSEFFTQRQLAKVRDTVDAELAADKAERATS